MVSANQILCHSKLKLSLSLAVTISTTCWLQTNDAGRLRSFFFKHTDIHKDIHTDTNIECIMNILYNAS
jgi:hypothetical protein